MSYRSDKAARLSLHQSNRRQRLKEARLKGTHTPEQWESLKAEFGFRCVRCGHSDCWLDRDHIIPIYAGGSDAIDNLQPLCVACNCGKGGETFNWVGFRRQHGFQECA
jgi:5-methylcytosine-specific restriction endonuclease McrA